MTDNDKHDLWLLGLANEKGKFALEVGLPLNEAQQAAFERGIDKEWFTLVDVSTIAEPTARGRWMRVFRLTTEGAYRVGQLNLAATKIYYK